MTVWKWPFAAPPERAAALALVATVSTASRFEPLFAPGRIPDTVEGRLESLLLHGALALMRLRAEPGAESLGQAFADAYFRHIDSGLREAAVGDLAVPRRMRTIAGQFYGRLDAYAGAVKDREALAEALGRNVFRDAAHPFAPALAHYAQKLRAQLGAAPARTLSTPEAWAMSAP